MRLSSNQIQTLKTRRLGIICGGRSLEHEVSLNSAKWALEAAKAAGVNATLLWLSKNNQWYRVMDQEGFLKNPQQVAQLNLRAISPILADPEKQWQTLDNSEQGKLDIVFPVMHGLDGEDGPMQGLFQFWNVAFIGPNIRDAVISMHKAITKTLLNAAGIKQVPWLVATNHITSLPVSLPADFTFPLFVKVSNGGSSIGVYKVKNNDELNAAIKKCWLLDRECLIEKAIDGQEIEVAALIGDEVMVADPGELEIFSDFYDYRSKYCDKGASMPHDTANISDELKNKIKATAKKVCEVLGAEGMTRVDFFVDKQGDFFVNEVNPIPGFTPISLFPVLWQKAGLDPANLLLVLMQNALNRFNKKNDALKQMKKIAEEAMNHE